MSAGIAIGSRARTSPSRLQREANEVEAAIALVAGRSQLGVMLCGLRHGGRLAAVYAARAAAAGVHLEPVRRDRRIVDIRFSRA
jgi:hypothetical protein